MSTIYRDSDVNSTHATNGSQCSHPASGHMKRLSLSISDHFCTHAAGNLTSRHCGASCAWGSQTIDKSNVKEACQPK